MTPNDETLCMLLRHSHEQALAGNTVSMDEAEQFMDAKIYEFTHRMNATCVAEPL